MFKVLKFIEENIRAFCRSRKRPPAQPASKIGIRKGPPGSIERDGNLPSATVIYNPAQALDIHINVLFALVHQPQKGCQTFCGHLFHV